MLEVRRYTPQDADEWNGFVRQARNTTFLLDRHFMDYHQGRFTDCSLIVIEDGKPLALLPANVKGDTLFSHGGLTYGGLIVDARMTAGRCMDTFAVINLFLKDELHLNRVVYKPTPWIYHAMPTEEDLYALSEVCHAQLTVREISTAVCLPDKLKFSKLRHRGVNKAKRNGIVVKESEDLPTFWHILDDNLAGKYNVHPVHTIAELQKLRANFPQRIRLFMAYLHETPLGGTLVFDCGQVVHTQYISASPQGKELGALDLVFAHLINHEFADRRYLDFGKSTENCGHYLNSNLIHQKEGFGGRGICYDTYEWAL